MRDRHDWPVPRGTATAGAASGGDGEHAPGGACLQDEGAAAVPVPSSSHLLVGLPNKRLSRDACSSRGCRYGTATVKHGGLVETIEPWRTTKHGGSTEVPGRVAGARRADDGRRTQGPGDTCRGAGPARRAARHLVRPRTQPDVTMVVIAQHAPATGKGRRGQGLSRLSTARARTVPAHGRSHRAGRTQDLLGHDVHEMANICMHRDERRLQAPTTRGATVGVLAPVFHDDS